MEHELVGLLAAEVEVVADSELDGLGLADFGGIARRNGVNEVTKTGIGG